MNSSHQNVNKSIKNMKSSIDTLFINTKSNENALSILSNIITAHEKSYDNMHEILNDLLNKFSKIIEGYDYNNNNSQSELLKISNDLSNLTVNVSYNTIDIVNLKNTITELI
jgi:hypothetical protein